MGFPVSNIIPLTVNIRAAGLAFANFSKAVLFAPESELPSGFSVDTYRDYSELPSLAADFGSGTEVYKAANRWLGGIPAMNQLTVYAVADSDTDWTTTLNKVRNKFWWFYSFFTKDVYANLTDVVAIAEWCNSNKSWFMNCQQATTNVNAIRDPNSTSDIASTLTASGYRFAGSFSHATDPYAGIALCKWFAKVNYSADRSTITGEGKKLDGVTAENLTGSEYNAMLQDTKKCMFYSVVDLQGSSDPGRALNTWSHSTYGEYMDDVVNSEAFANAVSVSLYNTVMSAENKLGQDPVDQAILIGTAKRVCQQFIANRYLGPRTYIDPDDGVEKFTAGFEILTKPEDILGLLQPDRDARKAAPLRIRIFRAGAIHKAPVDVSIY